MSKIEMKQWHVKNGVTNIMTNSGFGTQFIFRHIMTKFKYMLFGYRTSTVTDFIFQYTLKHHISLTILGCTVYIFP